MERVGINTSLVALAHVSRCARGSLKVREVSEAALSEVDEVSSLTSLRDIDLEQI